MDGIVITKPWFYCIVIVNGCVRDSAELATLNLGIKARGTHPRKTNKLNVGIMNVE